MPLSRLQVRNEYGLGVRELYSEASKKEDPKAILNGVAVAGLVGLLRQIGDLAEFAAEVFHGLQEEITMTTSRSQKMMSRVKHIETTLPPHEKAMLSQTSHIHFAYTPGTEWHPRIVNEQNHFIYTDLPCYLGDFYEECKEPPRLHLLDKFDTGGHGSCLKRYSDPTFFRRTSGNSSLLNDQKSKKERKARKAKKKISWKQRSSLLSDDASNTRVQISSPPRRHQPSPTQTVSTFDMTFKSDLVDRSRSDSHGSGDGMGFIECVFRPNTSLQTDENKSKLSFSESGDVVMNNNTLESKHPGKQILISSDDSPRSSIVEENDQRSSSDTWNDELEHQSCSELGKQETEQTIWKSWNDEVQEVHEPAFEFDEPDIGSVDRVSSGGQTDELKMEPLNENYELIEESQSPSVNLHKNEVDEVESETDNFVDALNTIESESENDLDSRTRVEKVRISDIINGESPSMSCDELDLCESTSVQDVPAGINFTKEDTTSEGLQEESVVNSSNVVDPVEMWTNGILLGLQPSKPPDFSTSSGKENKNNISAGDLNQQLKSPYEEAEHINDSRSMEHYKAPEAFGYKKTRELENSSMESAPPSPSIEHMKISFQPINSLGTSTLKLKYPEGINHSDEISDAFPSFQLVPEPTLQRGVDFDSDDDTFCRSIPYISDDEITHLSDSNSEMWESGDSPESRRDHTSHNRPCTSSSGESASGLAEHEEKEDTSIINDYTGSNVNPFGFQESRITFDFGELNLEPPPLPPLQWRIVRPQSNIEAKNPVSAFPHLAKPPSEDLIHRAREHVNVTANKKHSDEQNLKATAKKKLNQAGNAGRVDERDDFLHQIRTKSFNLRKTGLLNPAPAPTSAPPPPCVKVTAILEKAKTIRQAVASDDGEEDDPWSDA